MNINDRFWLWGHGRQCDNVKGKPLDLRGRPRISTISLAEAARYMGIPNICRIALETVESPPFDEEAAACQDLRQIVWSVLGCGVIDARNDLDEVLRLAQKYPNVTGGIMDDFFPTANPEKMTKYPPAVLAKFADRLHHELERRLDLWVVVYSSDFQYPIKPYLDPCDVGTIWTWNSDDLVHLEETYRQMRVVWGEERRLLAGCYMWNFPGRKAIPLKEMKDQLDTYDRWLDAQKIDGIIFCHNYLVDLGLEAVEYTRNWIAERA
jgi:hypothetical protein